MGYFFPIFLTLGFTAPGVLTLMFALNEADRWGHDWVLVSGPLLFLGGLCLSWTLKRAMGLGGLAFGLLLTLGGLGYAGMRLDGSIKEREHRHSTYQAFRKEIPKLEALCRGGAPLPDAAAYDKTKAGTHKLIAFDIIPPLPSQTTPPEPRQVYELPDGWGVRTLTETELVGCVTERYASVETCRYSTGVLTRYRVDQDVSVREAKTGTVVLTQTFTGGEPDACQATEAFYSGSTVSGKYGSKKVLKELIEAMRPAVVVGAP